MESAAILVELNCFATKQADLSSKDSTFDDNKTCDMPTTRILDKFFRFFGANELNDSLFKAGNL